jgi:hypothetical protein
MLAGLRSQEWSICRQHLPRTAWPPQSHPSNLAAQGIEYVLGISGAFTSLDGKRYTLHRSAHIDRYLH